MSAVIAVFLFARLSRIQNAITLVMARKRQVWSYTVIYAATSRLGMLRII
jgi:hypothetical protein